MAAARLPLACLLAGALLGAGWSLLSEPRYVSRAHLVVPVPESGDHAAAVGLARIHSRLAVEPVVLERAAATLGVPVSDLSGRIRSAGSPDAPVIEITATDTDPVRAAGMADAVAGALVAHGADLAVPEVGGVPAPLPLAGARPASSPTSPSPA
ncbi:lipopolysaccharide biosynthesis protein, partial [Streptomyces alkaliphilus]|nr:lipopolysaccharide biosynthesis protein [Streptomyces alkaliphilus]